MSKRKVSKTARKEEPLAAVLDSLIAEAEAYVGAQRPPDDVLRGLREVRAAIDQSLARHPAAVKGQPSVAAHLATEYHELATELRKALQNKRMTADDLRILRDRAVTGYADIHARGFATSPEKYAREALLAVDRLGGPEQKRLVQKVREMMPKDQAARNQALRSLRLEEVMVAARTGEPFEVLADAIQRANPRAGLNVDLELRRISREFAGAADSAAQKQVLTDGVARLTEIGADRKRVTEALGPHLEQHGIAAAEAGKTQRFSGARGVLRSLFGKPTGGISGKKVLGWGALGAVSLWALNKGTDQPAEESAEPEEPRTIGADVAEALLNPMSPASQVIPELMERAAGRAQGQGEYAGMMQGLADRRLMGEAPSRFGKAEIPLTLMLGGQEYEEEAVPQGERHRDFAEALIGM